MFYDRSADQGTLVAIQALNGTAVWSYYDFVGDNNATAQQVLAILGTTDLGITYTNVDTTLVL